MHRDAEMSPDMIERQSLCLAQPMPGVVAQPGQSGFKDALARIFDSAESNAAEQLVDLKHALRNADTDAFWALLTKGLARIADAQYAFVSKRILIDDKDVPVELPPIGEPGACLMGEAFYINDDHGSGPGHLRHFKYHAYACPCAYMKHDKIFIIPERLNDFIVNNPNDLIIPGEAYFGVPLFAEGKCFAHFGVMWGKEGAARRQLSWAFLEMIFHSLEDMILDRVLRGIDFAQSAQVAPVTQTKIVPHEAVSVAQSLKPYARSLSHELRTPMQGVVGMLDVMMANLKEASEIMHLDLRTREVLDTLKENIEAVQDSSRRAVEAADNVVHAYDMNMGVPETPLSPLNRTPDQWNPFWREMRPDLMITGNSMAQVSFRGLKRKRDEASCAEGRNKPRVARLARQRIRESFSEEPPVRGAASCPPCAAASCPPCANAKELAQIDQHCSHKTFAGRCDSTCSPLFASEHSKAPGFRHTNLREVLQHVINDALKVGGRPDSAVAEATGTGERIEVRTRSSDGQAHTKWIEWTVSPDVPDTIVIDDRDLAKMVSCLALNAIKFTHEGSITLQANLSAKGRYIVINIKDTGSGIPAAFLPNLFKPFSREDVSTTRQSEGLGLGLMVAKGIARKLGGDLFCLRSHVSGPKRGSEFEMRVPLAPGEVCSRPTTPFGSPTPSIKSHMSIDCEMPQLDINHVPVTPPLTHEPFQAERETPSLAAQSVSVGDIGLPTPHRSSSPPHHGRAVSSDVDIAPAELAKHVPLNFLVVDDNAINRRVLVNMLGRLGYKKVVTAFNGHDAVETMRRNVLAPGSEAIDVVLMDLWMPLRDGFQASEAILAMPEYGTTGKKPTIVAVSADVTDTALEKAVDSGMSGFITKPFVSRDIVRLIRTYCANRER